VEGSGSQKMTERTQESISALDSVGGFQVSKQNLTKRTQFGQAGRPVAGRRSEAVNEIIHPFQKEIGQARRAHCPMASG
jgi:hypothetical protein